MRIAVTRVHVLLLRGSAWSPHMGAGDAHTRVVAARLHPMKIAVTRVRVSLLRRLARSPHMGTGDAHTRVVAARLRPMKIAVTRKRVPPLRGSGRSIYGNACAPACGSRDPRPAPKASPGESLCGAEEAPKARQIFSLGRQPQETGGRPIKEPRRGDRYIAWGVSPRKRCGQLRPALKGRQTFNGDVNVRNIQQFVGSRGVFHQGPSSVNDHTDPRQALSIHGRDCQRVGRNDHNGWRNAGSYSSGSSIGDNSVGCGCRPSRQGKLIEMDE